MGEDKTEILIEQSLTGRDLTPEEARQVAERLEDNTKAMQRFMAIEDQIDDILSFVRKAKQFGKWIGGLLLANYALTFREAIENMVLGL